MRIKKKIIGILIFIVAILAVWLLYDYHSYVEEVKIDTTYKVIEEKRDIDPNLLRDYNLDELKAKNNQLWGWLYVPNSSIDRYVMKEPEFNKFKYLWRNIDNKINRSGSYFVPAEPNGEDGKPKANDVTEIFGHHLSTVYDNAPMFTGLIKMYNNGENAKKHEYAYTYKDGVATKWKVWIAANVDDTDEIYQIPYVKECPCYRDAIEHLREKSVFEIGDKPDYKSEDMLILSTCEEARLRIYW